MKEPETFQDLVTWACWTVMEGITQGKTLRESIYLVLDYTRRWQPPKAD